MTGVGGPLPGRGCPGRIHRFPEEALGPLSLSGLGSPRPRCPHPGPWPASLHSPFHLLSGLQGGRDRSAQPCSSLPVWGLSPQTPPNRLATPVPLPPPGLITFTCHQNSTESLASQGVLGWKVGPSCKRCTHEPGYAQSKPGSPMTDPSGRELDAPTPAAHTLRLGGLSATCWPPPLRQGPPPMEAGAVFYVFRAPSTTELL